MDERIGLFAGNSRNRGERFDGFGNFFFETFDSDFLGVNVRRYPNGKLLIKPSKAAVMRFRQRVRTEMRDLRGSNAAAVIARLNAWKMAASVSSGNAACNSPIFLSNAWAWATWSVPSCR